ncbi:MAG: gamma-glutamylcyclotransferase [Verrucomicrobiales bacterium]|nr:gamma-glutamylcyclotransferase [Verrucomicrobiales bacterium]
MNLFAYGTLLVPEIWELVTGCSVPELEAEIRGFEIRRVKGGDFPVIFESENPDAVVPGRVFRDLNQKTIARLDTYEDTFYERIDVRADLKAGGGEIECQTYAVPVSEAMRISAGETWTLEWFKNHAFEAYLSRLQGWRENE